ncbi:MAG: hypothetical protein KJ069_02865 [Anaerolineae bacterium]|nr:hypothetical protein [Anaerolineae bacterium]
MIAAKANILGLLLVSLILGGCTPEAVMPATLPPTRTVVVTETGMGTAVAQPPSTATTISPTIPDTATPDPSQTTDLQIIERTPSTPVSTNTPRPTFTPSPTPTPAVFDLPEWVADPAVNVLLLGSYHDNETITLFNADTGEQFEIHVETSDLSPQWLWQEGNYFLSPTSPRIGQDVIDIETGEVVKLADVNEDVWSALSPDGRYIAHIIEKDERTDVITIKDQETGVEKELYNPFQDSSGDYWQSGQPHWSPDGALLAVVYDKRDYYDNSDYDLAIYMPSGELFRQFGNMRTFWYAPWSPVLPYRMLVTDGQSYISRQPCILDVIENKQNCIETIAERVDNQNVWPTNYIWSPDGSKISFIHFAREERVNINGVCYIELATEEIFCPITPDDLQLEEQINPRLHFWSPNGRHLILFLDRHGMVDVSSPLAGALVNSDGQNFQIIGRDFSLPYTNPWRPSIPSPSQE